MKTQYDITISETKKFLKKNGLLVLSFISGYLFIMYGETGSVEITKMAKLFSLPVKLSIYAVVAIISILFLRKAMKSMQNLVSDENTQNKYLKAFIMSWIGGVTAIVVITVVGMSNSLSG